MDNNLNELKLQLCFSLKFSHWNATGNCNAVDFRQQLSFPKIIFRHAVQRLRENGKIEFDLINTVKSWNWLWAWVTNEKLTIYECSKHLCQSKFCNYVFPACVFLYLCRCVSFSTLLFQHFLCDFSMVFNFSQ